MLRDVILCEDCRYFYIEHSGEAYGKCSKMPVVVRRDEFCSRGKPKATPFPEYDDHTVSGLIDE